MSDSSGPVAVGRAARGTVARSAIRIVVVLLQGGLVAILARALAPDVFGAFVAAAALLGIVDIIGEFGTTATAVVEMGKRPDDASAIARACQRANLLMLVVGVAASMPILLLGYSSHSRLAYACLLPATVVNRFASSYVALRQHRLDLGRLGVAELVGRAVTVVLAALLLLVSASPEGGLGIIGGAYFVGALMSLAIERVRLGVGRSDGAVTGRTMLRAAAPLGLAGAVSFVHVRADQVLLEVLDRVQDLGAYAIAYRVLEGSVGILALAAGGMVALLSRTASEDRWWLASRSLAVIDVLGVLVSCAVLATAGPIGHLLGGRDVPNTDVFIALIAPLVWVSAVNTVFASLCIVSGRAGRLIRIAVVGTVANIVGCLAIIPTWGARGAASVTIATEVFGLAMVAREASRSVEIQGYSRRLLTDLACLAIVGPLWYRVWDGTGDARLAVPALGVVAVTTIVRNRVELRAAARRVQHAAAST
ncbi:MAG: hypothetical protein QOG30_2422 [Acidimicrobiaceae bacterium]